MHTPRDSVMMIAQICGFYHIMPITKFLKGMYGGTDSEEFPVNKVDLSTPS
jgi:hypothetical protein